MIYRDGGRLIIEPVLNSTGLLALLDGLQPLDEDFPNVDECVQPLDSVHL